MIYTVTLNPAIDYNVWVDNYKTGAVNRTSYETLTAGGKGINVSVILNRLDIPTVAWGFCGGFTGKTLTTMLEDMNISNEMIEVSEGTTRINVKLHTNSLTDKTEAETEINGIGAKISDAEMQVLYNKIEGINENDYLVLAGSVPKSMSVDIYSKLMEKANKRKAKVIVDTSGDSLLMALKQEPFLVKPNNIELGEIFNVNINDYSTAIKYAEKLQKLGAKNVLVSMGGSGAVLVSEEGASYLRSAPKSTVKNTVGAGDSMLAGFIAGVIMFDNNFEDALRLGIASGSATAFSDGLAENDKILEIFRSLP